MKCDEIKTHLAEYLEGSLPEENKALVKEHLQKCADCRDELQFLKKYMKKIESFPSIKAPDDFLEKIHKRIDTPEHGGIIEMLFFPLKIKLPLEAAALLAIAMTGVLLFKPFKPDVTEYTSGKPAPRIAREDERTLLKDEGSYRRDRSAATVMDTDKAREKDVELVPDKKVAVAGNDDGMVAADSTVSEQLSKEEQKSSRVEQAEITLYLKQNTVSGAEPALDDSFLTQKSDQAKEARNVSRKSLGAAKKEKAAAERVMQSVPSSRNQAAVDGIASLAQSLEGRIVKKVYDEKTQSERLLIVEIPSKNYAQFMKGLSGRWSIQKQYPAEFPRRSSKVQINMNLQN